MRRTTGCARVAFEAACPPTTSPTLRPVVDSVAGDQVNGSEHTMPTWDEYYMGIALAVREKANCLKRRLFLRPSSSLMNPKGKRRPFIFFTASLAS